MTLDNLEIAYKKGFKNGRETLRKEVLKVFDLMVNSLEKSETKEDMLSTIDTAKKYITFMSKEDL